MTAHLSQQQRFELKYLVDEPTAAAIRDWLVEYLTLDYYCRDKPNYSYANHSVYLDSPCWQYFWDTIAEKPTRYKLRVRFYDDASSPIYLEIKRRSGDLIVKHRAEVTREEAENILQGQAPTPTRLSVEHQAHVRAVQEFRELMVADQAAPRLHLAYYREAWIDTAEPVMRFTMDRTICCEHQTDCGLNSDLKNPLMPWGDQVIATVKFRGRFPDWFWNFQSRFKLQPCNPAKYATCVSMLEKRRDPTGIGYPDSIANVISQRMRCG